MAYAPTSESSTRRSRRRQSRYWAWNSMTAQLELKHPLIHYVDALHSLSGQARNIQATIQPDDPTAPAASWMNTVALSATNSTFAYDGRPINNIGVEAHARINQTRAEIQ